MRKIWALPLLTSIALVPMSMSLASAQDEVEAPRISAYEDVSYKTPLFPDLNIARDAVREKQYDKAIAHLEPIAEAGFGRANRELGKLYARGRGVEIDHAKAIENFQTAYDDGDVNSLIEIGRLTELGRGFDERDPIKAKVIYAKAAAEGKPRGLYLIGQMYEKGRLSPSGSAEQDANSVKFIKDSIRSFREGDFSNATKAADIYYTGQGVAADPMKALVFAYIPKLTGAEYSDSLIRKLEWNLSINEAIDAQRKAEAIIDGKAGRDILKQYMSETSGPTETAAQEQQRMAIAQRYFKQAQDAGYVTPDQRAQLDEVEDDQDAQEITPDVAPNLLTRITQPIQNLVIANDETNKKYRIKATARTQFNIEDNLDLGTRGQGSANSKVLDGLVGVNLYPTDKVSAYIEGRGFLSDGSASSNTDDDEDENDSSFVEMRQAWVEFDEVLSPLTSVKIGRQRFSEPRAILWNRDLDAVRFSLDSTLNNGFVAVGQNLSNYRAGKDNDFEGDEKDRLRVLGEFEHLLNTDHKFSARFIYENDHSGTQTPGDVIDEVDRDNEDFDMVWTGLRAEGQVETPQFNTLNKITYRADVIAVNGTEEITASSSGPAPDERTIIGTNERDVFGYAFDGSVTAQTQLPYNPAFTLGYAYGSGDDDASDTGKSSEFRQTDLHGNSSRFPFGLASETNRNYGEVLRPELSNLHILNAGVQIPMFVNSDASVNYFRYYRDQTETDLRSASINAPMNADDRYLGQALDLGINVDLDAEFGLKNKLVDNTSLRIRAGAFDPGDAYTGNDDYAYRGTVEIRAKF